MTEQLTRTQSPPQPAARGRRVVDDVKVALVTAASAAVTWVLWTQAAGVDLVVGTTGGDRQVGIASVLISTIVLVLAGGALLRWLQRRSARGLQQWTRLAVAFAVISMFGPTSALTLEAGLGLASLHLVVAAVAIPALRWRHGDR